MRFIVILSDTFRYDNLTTLPTRTPELDAFAKTAVFFTNAWHASFPTIPNRCDLATGKYCYPFRGWAPLPAGEKTLAEVLRDNGYITQLIADTPHLMKHEYNYSRGFVGYDWTRGQEGDIFFTWMNHPIERRMAHEKTRMSPLFRGEPLVNLAGWTNRRWDGEEDTFPAQTCRKACHWLEHNYREPNFLLWLDLFDPHEPWDPPEYLVRRYDPAYRGAPMMHPNYGPASDYTPAELKNLRAHYFAESELVSKWIGTVLRKVEEVGIAEETCIVFTADHGHYIGEHDRTGKSNICKHDDRGPWPLYAEVGHIPLIIRLPGARAGRKVGAFAEPVDLMPTLLDLANVQERPEGHGLSLVPLLQGAKEPWPRDFTVGSSALAVGEKMQWTSVRDRSFTLILGPGEAQLYDRRTDPGETKDVMRSNRATAERLKRKLLQRLESVGTDPVKLAALEAAM